MDIKIYTTPSCGYCHQAKRFLSDLGVSYREVDVSRDQAAAQEMVNLTGQMGVPVIVVDGEVIIGFDRARLEQLIRTNGKSRPRLGLKVADADRMSRQQDQPPVFGALVGSVSPSSPGQKAGIRKGDIITSINRKRINNAAELEDFLRTLSGGSRLQVTFYRGEKANRAEITV